MRIQKEYSIYHQLARSHDNKSVWYTPHNTDMLSDLNEDVRTKHSHETHTATYFIWLLHVWLQIHEPEQLCHAYNITYILTRSKF